VWSIHRIDAQLGRYLDINSAWRDPQEQERLYTAYRSYVNGNGPWAPIALPPEQSVHCKGEAIDTDDNNAAMTRILNNNGWFHTVFRNGVLVEPWHYEYDYKRDKFYGGQPAGSGSGSTPIEEDDMYSDKDRERDNTTARWIDLLGHNLLDGRPEHYNGQYTPIDVLLSYVWSMVPPVQDTQKRVRGSKPDIDMLQDTLLSIKSLGDRLTAIEAKLPKA